MSYASYLLPYVFHGVPNVHRFAALAAVAAAVGLLMPTEAESFTYGRLVAGQVKGALAYGIGSSWCLVDNGGTEFQINQVGSKAVISFVELTYFDGTAYYALNGQTILTFSSTTTGSMHFKQRPDLPDPVHNPTFTNFAQTYSAATDQLIVSFNILFPTCTLPIYAAYDAP
jgi:hypothetical protein